MAEDENDAFVQVAYGRQSSALSEAPEEDGEVNQFDILVQSIPYYAMGQAKTDALVRATLMHLDDDFLEAIDEGGNTLLMLACQNRHEDLVRILLQKGANANATNAAGACCLHFPCYSETCSMPIAKALLQAGANPEVAEKSYGCTPLHYCASIGDINFCKLLISYGALVGTRDLYDYTAVDYAREGNMTDCTAYLQKVLISAAQEGVNGFAAMGGNTPQVSHVTFGSPTTEVREGKGYAAGRGVNFEQHGSIAMGNGSGDIGLPEGRPAYDDLEREESSMSLDPSGMQSASVRRVSMQEDEWESHVDPASGGIYFINHCSGECLWEEDYLELKNQKPSLLSQSAPTEVLEPVDELVMSITRSMSKKKLIVDTDVTVGTPTAGPASVKQLRRADTLKGIGRMDTKKQYELLSETQMKSMMDLDVITVPQSSQEEAMVKMVDANSVRKLMDEVKLASAETLEKERLEFRTTLSENNGRIVKLEAEVERLKSEKGFLESSLADANANRDTSSVENAAQMKELNDNLALAEKDNVSLRAEVSVLKDKLLIETEKLETLQSTLANLQSGHGEQIEEVQKRTEEQNAKLEAIQKEHATELQAKEDQLATLKARVAAQLKKLKAKAEDTQKAHTEAMDKQHAESEEKIVALNNELVEMKSKFVQDLSNAELLAEANNRKAAEAEEAANEARALAKNYEDEIHEMRDIKKMNQKLLVDFNKEQIIRKRLHNEIEDMKGKIRVYLRVRPFSNSEAERGCTEAVVKDGKQSICVKGASGPDSKKSYEFDSVFGGGMKDGNSQEDVFTDTKHLITSVVDGYNVCIFAYGQTGAGKSFTMIGAGDISKSVHDDGTFDQLAGIAPRAVTELFRVLEDRSAQMTYQVEVQMFQLYRDGLEDLLCETKKEDKGKKKPNLKITLAEHSPTGLVQVQGAEIKTASSAAEVMKIFSDGSKRRTVASTNMNSESSRSHLICCVTVNMVSRQFGTEKNILGKLTLVDLAGSERLDKSGAEGDMMKEAQSINKSLSALGDVIASLTSGKGGHTPYRNHPLTMLMSDSIGGNAKTLMFVNCSPADYNVSETVSSLGFAQRCKDVQNTGGKGGAANANQSAQVKALRDELMKLKKAAGGGESASADNKPKAGKQLRRPAGAPKG